MEALNVSKKFQDIRDEMVLQYGYDRFETNSGGNSTQEEFTAKTLKQCDSESETPGVKFQAGNTTQKETVDHHPRVTNTRKSL